MRTNLSPKAALELAEAINRRAVNRDLSISDDSGRAHQVRCCDAVRSVTQATKATASIIVDESLAPNDHTATAEELDEYFFRSVPEWLAGIAAFLLLPD